MQATPSELGLILLAIAAGAVIAMPLAGLVVNRFGPARTVAVLATVLSVGLVVLASARPVGVLPVVIGLFLIGYGNGTWDVAMNVEGAAVEQRLGRTIMPRFHAGFSVARWSVRSAAGAASRSSRSPPTCWPWQERRGRARQRTARVPATNGG